jgi:hypothetical protein
MHLFELTHLLPPAPAHSVPEWTHGCFRRRSITFFNGVEDTDSEVIWLQSRGLTADFRRSPPALGVRRAELAELPLEQLIALARVEGGFARTRWDGELMHWSKWVSFQTHAKWPEPGRLERVGASLVEFAPSGAYVEDWRFQPGGPGPFIGLSLLDERDLDSDELVHRGGGLIVCGTHAAFVRGRPAALSAGRVEDFVRAHAGDASSLARVFSFDAAYGTASSELGDYRVQLSTLPWREGEALLSLEGFSQHRELGLVLQRVEESGRRIERRFTIDTLERELRAGAETPASAAAVEWLAAEGDALLATAR